MQQKNDIKNQFTLELPKELFFKNIPLNIQDVHHLSSSSSHFSFFRYRSQLNDCAKGDAYLLMDKVIHFHLKEAEEIVRNNPSCLFEQIRYAPDSKVNFNADIQIHSPLQKAFWNCDSYMWTLFFNLIKDDPRLLEIFKQQMDEVEQHYNIAPLEFAYSNYLSYFLEEKINFDKLEENDPKLIKALELFKQIRIQQDNLPRHMIFEMCRPGQDLLHYDEVMKKEYFSSCAYLWTPDGESDFAISENLPPPAKIILYCDELNALSMPVNSLSELETLEGRYLGALTRGDCSVGASILEAAGTLVRDDQLTFSKLFAQRLDEFNKFKHQLLNEPNEHVHSCS